MALAPHLVDFGLLRYNADFRRLFVARTVSLLGLGLLTVAVPVQVYDLSGSSFLVGLALALEGGGMVVGLLVGGVLADRTDRRRLILIARATCGLGFAGLAVNGCLPVPSLSAIFVLSLWDGLFGALSVTGLMAAMPSIVGRENLLQARALGVLTVRFATVVSPLLGGAIIASAGVAWNYAGAAVATLLTVVTLIGLPPLPPPPGPTHHPLRMVGEAVDFLVRRRVLLEAVALGSLVSLTGAVRALFPALAAERYGGTGFDVGLMYAMIPAGAATAAVFSGWTLRLERPGIAFQTAGFAACAAIAGLGLADSLPAALGLLLANGYAATVAGLLQYTLIQGHTPDRFLGRVNSLWTAQEVAGGGLAALAVGSLTTLLAPAAAAWCFGGGALMLAAGAVTGFGATRRAPFQDPTLSDANERPST